MKQAIYIFLFFVNFSLSAMDPAVASVNKAFTPTTKGSIVFFEASKASGEKFFGMPKGVLNDYIAALTTRSILLEAKEQAVREHQDSIVPFVHDICPQVKLKGIMPSAASTYQKSSPKTYLHDEKKAQTTASLLAMVNSKCKHVTAELKKDCFGKFTKFELTSVDGGPTGSSRCIVSLPSPGSCVAIDPVCQDIYCGLENGRIVISKKGESTLQSLWYHRSPVRAIRFFYDNNLFITKTDTKVVIWHRNVQRPLLTLDAKKYGHDHVFNHVIVCSHAGDGYNKDLEYQIPYTWTNFDAVITLEQLAYIYILYALLHSKLPLGCTRLDLLSYLLVHCFSSGFEEPIARAFYKRLQEYLTENKILMSTFDRTHLMPESVNFGKDSLFFKELLVEADRKELAEFTKAVLDFIVTSGLLNELSKELEGVLKKENNIALKYVRHVMPQRFTIGHQVSANEFQQTYTKSAEKKLQPITVPTDFSKFTKFKATHRFPKPKNTKENTATITEVESSIEIIRITVNFLPDYQLIDAQPGSNHDKVNSMIQTKKVDITLWDDNVSINQIFSLSSPVSCLALEPQDCTMILGLESGSLAFIDCKTIDKKEIKLLVNGHQKPVKAIKFSPSGRFFVSQSDDCTYVWRTGDHDPIFELQFDYAQNYYDLYVFDEYIIASYNGYTGATDYVFDLPPRLLHAKAPLTRKEVFYFFGLRQVHYASTLSKNETTAKIVNNLYNSPYGDSFGKNVKLALRYFLQKKAKELDIALQDTTYSRV